MPNSYRIRTQVGVDKFINVELNQDFEYLEILSLKILANDVYTRSCSDYGVVVGRVVVNGGYGVPNARVSVFVPLDAADANNPVIAELYPYQNLSDRNEEGYRYNLLFNDPSYNGHKATGSFPSKSDVLMNQSWIEVYDKYYRYTAKTNESGDFMLFGVPVGDFTLVMDVDVSDIGCFSLSPQDLLLDGIATEAQVDGASFKTSNNLDELPQIINLNFDVNVRPLWGDPDLCRLGITRVDFDLTKQANLKINPTAVFMGSIISTTDDDSISIGCRPKNDTGNLCELIANPGQILAIRQTVNTDNNGLPILEQYVLPDDGKVIDSDGTFVVNLPMNLEYVYTNEFGEQIISQDPTKGIPTKGKYRFKFKWINKEKSLSLNNLQTLVNKQKAQIGFKDNDYSGNFQRANFLVPNIKEYGWQQSDQDPFEIYHPETFNYTIPAGSLTGSTVTFPTTVGLQFSSQQNSGSYTIYINNQPYFGSVESITIPFGSTFFIVSTPVSTTTQQNFVFTKYPEKLLEVLKSYAFSLDWNDYANPIDAINCKDTFYEFNYNKVYTTALFLDRFKKGAGRAKHLGIKEIDNRSCKSKVNTFPVNDVIKNFDPIFFIFNALINILTYPILTLLWITHFVAWSWPILKWILIILTIFLAALNGYQAFVAANAAVNAINAILHTGSVNAGGPIIDPSSPSNIVATAAAASAAALQNLFMAALYSIFTGFLIGTPNRLRIPRLSLPMLSYPDCSSCDCKCNDAELDDNFDVNSVNALIAEQMNSSNNNSSSEVVLAIPTSFLAPVNSPDSYDILHPNIQQSPVNGIDAQDGPFFCSGLGCDDFESLAYTLSDDGITPEVLTRAQADFQRIISGYDILSSTSPIQITNNEHTLLHAPQPFLFAARKKIGPDLRFYGYPVNQTYPQRLNEFNTRDKYFNNSTGNVFAPNRIKVNVNNSTQAYYDQVVVMLAKQGTTSNIGIGNLLTFQDPALSGCKVNLTGGTFNQFNNNAITGHTFTGQTNISISYADYTNDIITSNVYATVTITADSQTQISYGVNSEQTYLKYPIDLEYFQVVTGMSVSNFLSIANTTTTGFFPKDYLLHEVKYIYPGCNIAPGCNSGPDYNIGTTGPALYLMQNYTNYEVIIMVRGVDPHTQKQNIKYDLSRIFGSVNTNPNYVIQGEYYMNIPIQSHPISKKPVSHLTGDNNGHNLYFQSYSLVLDPATPGNPNFTAFTSTMPYTYLATDDNFYLTYTPITNLVQPNNSLSLNFASDARLSNNQFSLPTNQTNSNNTYYGGSSYLASVKPISISTDYNLFEHTQGTGCNSNCEKAQYFYNGSSPNIFQLTGLYSAAYYRNQTTGISFNNRLYTVMRSDRIPTSTNVENGAQYQTGYGMHQNNNFTYFNNQGVESPLTINGGYGVNDPSYQDLDPMTSGLTSTLQCDGMVSLRCYSGNGFNVTVVPSNECVVPADRVVNGCYCLLNKGGDGNKPKYLINGAYKEDAMLFLEWKQRYTLNLAACRGVFGQVFQNNWINGTLYMFSFNTQKFFGLNPNQPNYTNRKFYRKYCGDVILFNDITNSFFYRSSPWDGLNFIGKEPKNFTGGYNRKNIQFPTTIADLGPRDYFINEICANRAFGSYYADQLNTTSYQDNGYLIQLGFLSRILSSWMRNAMLPTSIGDQVDAGVSIDEFFDNTRDGFRIDGDIAQMLSINSEWKVSPVLSENVPNNSYIFFGDEGPLGSVPNKPVFGVFFSSTTEEFRYRQIMSQGVETYSRVPLIREVFGYPKTQVVPHYKWKLAKSSYIFGTEDNNWYTDHSNFTGFFKKGYQDLNFTSPYEKYRTTTSQFGYITNFTAGSNQVPNSNPSNVLNGQPVNVDLQSVVVGAPYYFYFGLNVGSTALDRFYKLYVTQ